jgi:hypothetical protein
MNKTNLVMVAGFLTLAAMNWAVGVDALLDVTLFGLCLAEGLVIHRRSEFSVIERVS